MRIGIIGAGRVGGTLGTGWQRSGHDVMFGVRSPQDKKLQPLLEQSGAKAGTVEEAVACANVIALTVPWSAVEQVLRGAEIEAGKILLDCTNPVMKPPGTQPEDRLSGAEKVAQWVAGVRVVKIFNTTGFENMANPRFGSNALTMFYAGDDANAKAIAAQLAGELGFDPVDAGALGNARHLEVLASFWGALAYGQKMGRGIGFSLLRR